MKLVLKVVFGLVGAAVVVVALVAGGVSLWSHAGERRIMATADQLRVPQDWVVLEWRAKGPGLCILSDVSCPSVSRSWRAPHDMTTSDFSKLFTSSDWKLELEKGLGDCERSRPNRNAKYQFHSCWAHGWVDGYRANLYYDDPATSDPTSGILTLQLDPA
jgi:hypothetical protein